MNRPKSIRILSEDVLNLIAPKVQSPEAEETEEYINSLLKQLDGKTFKKGAHRV